MTNSDFSIDVTNPMYVKTKNMAKLVGSVTKRRKKEYTQGKNLDYSNFLPLSQFFVLNFFFDQDVFISV